MKTTVAAGVEGKARDLTVFEQVTRYAVLAIFIFMPLAINPFGFQPYTLIKVTIFRLLLAMAVLFWVLTAVFFRKSLTIAVSRAHLYWMGYLGAAALATIFSVSPRVSLSGWFMRYDGLLSLVSYAIFFVVCYQFFADRESLIDLLQIVFASSFLISIYGLAEFLGFSILPELSKDPSRIASLWGNAGYLGGFIALTLPISVAAAIAGDKFPKIKWPALINMAVAIPVLVFSHTRSAWVGVSAAILIILVKYVRLIDYKAAIAAGIAVAITAGFIAVGPLSSSTAAGKAALATSVNVNSQARFYYWRVAASSFLKRPLLGYGPDTFNYVYRQNRSADWLRHDTERAPVDKAHNDLLQVAVTTGVIGLIAYVALIGFLIYSMAARVREDDSEDTVLVFAVLTGLISYLIFSQAFFSIGELAPLFWGIAAAGYGLHDKSRRELDIKVPTTISRSVIAVVVIALTAIFSTFTIRSLGADLRFKRGFDLASEKLWVYVAEENEQAVRLDPYESTYRLYLGQSLNNYASAMRSADAFNEAAGAYKGIISLDPKLVDAYVGLGDTYYNQSRVTGKETFDDALNAYDKALELDPFSPQIKSRMALTLAGLAKFDKAVAVLNEAIEIDENDPKLYIDLSRVYRDAGRREKSEAVLEKALKKWPDDEALKEEIKKRGSGE